MTIMTSSDMPGITRGDYEQLPAALLPVLQSMDGFIAHAACRMPPGGTPPIITTRPITKIATRA